jgi:hypothetical protein
MNQPRAATIGGASNFSQVRPVVKRLVEERKIWIFSETSPRFQASRW